MKRIFGVLVAATLALTGCPKETNNVKLDGGADLRMNATGDMTMTAKAANGEPCTKNADCTGNYCFTESTLGFPGGTCASSCAANNPCDDGESCVNFGGSIGGKCILDCDATDSCRDGYQCWIGWNCLPALEDFVDADAVLCDPTAANTCGAGKACQRAVHSTGAGMNGICVDTCVLGVGTCPESSGGSPQICTIYSANSVLLVDAETLADVYTGDKGIYATCTFDLEADAVANGEECLSENTPGDGNRYSQVCVSGSQCAISALDYSNDYGPTVTGGDNLCRTLCYEAGQIPVINPDAGVSGTPFATCPNGTTCKNAFGLFGNTAGNIKAGLCQP